MYIIPACVVGAAYVWLDFCHECHMVLPLPAPPTPPNHHRTMHLSLVSGLKPFFVCLLQIVLRVWLDSRHERHVDVPITPSTTASDVVDCCRQPGEDDCHLAELWRGCGKYCYVTIHYITILYVTVIWLNYGGAVVSTATVTIHYVTILYVTVIWLNYGGAVVSTATVTIH